MIKENFFIILMTTIILSACGSAPKVVYTPAGQQHFSGGAIKYRAADVSVSSENENKAIQAGYMSNDAVKAYIETEIQAYLKSNGLLSDDGVEIKILFDINRVYSWGGSSMASFEYSAKVILEKNEQVLASYGSYGQVQDNSIAGNFKTIFGKNEPAKENKYINVAINSILAKLPKKLQ